MGDLESYEDGAVVWVKLGARWWPGQVLGYDELPEDVRRSFRKPPIAVVRFFQEESFEYVKNINFICKYNCNRKHEFIKKGLELQRLGLAHMQKFPADVRRAEELTHGDPELLAGPEFQAAAPAPRRSGAGYAGLFGEPAPSPSKTYTPGKKGRPPGSPSKWKIKSEKSSDRDSPRITHPRMIQKILKGTSDYKAHILVQESSKVTSPPGTPEPAAPSSVPGSGPSCSPGSAPPSPSPSPSPSLGSPGLYTCHACAFTSVRLNVIILHNKSHSAGFLPYTPPKKHKIKSPVKIKFRAESPLDDDLEPATSSTPVQEKTPLSADKKPRGRPKKVRQEVSEAPCLGGNLLGEKTSSTPAKRKAGKNKEKEPKKPKTDVEIKNSLLADWSEDSNASMDLLTSLNLTEIQNPSTPECEKHIDAVDSSGVEADDLKGATTKMETSGDLKPASEGQSDLTSASVTKDVDSPVRSKVRKLASCFDFDDEDEELPIESLGRKIPRLSSKSDEVSKKNMIEAIETATEALSPPEVDRSEEDDAKKKAFPEPADLALEINNLLEETVVPSLPSLPCDVKFTDSPKVAVLPTKNSEKENSNDKQSGKSIFKTKTFFRSRHSRSQDAIEKYVADNTSVDKPPTYMEDVAAAEAQPDAPKATAGVELDPEDRQASPPVHATKLAPKIQLKKIKAVKMQSPDKKKKNLIEPSEAESESALKEKMKDKWDNDTVADLLKTDEVKSDNVHSANDLLGTIEDHLGSIEDPFDNVIIKERNKALVKNTNNKILNKSFVSNTYIANEHVPMPDVEKILEEVVESKHENNPTDSDLQIAETLLNLPTAGISKGSDRVSPPRETSQAQEQQQDKQQEQQQQEEQQQEQQQEEQQQEQQQEEQQQEEQQQEQKQEQQHEQGESKLTESDKSFNAAESLVQMSETFQNEQIQNVSNLTKIFSEDPEAREANDDSKNESSIEEKPILNKKAPQSAIKNSNIGEGRTLTNTTINESLKSCQVSDEPMKVIKPKPALKILSTKIITPQGREKILNFDVGSGSPPKAAAVPSQKQKVIIRRTAGVHKPAVSKSLQPHQHQHQPQPLKPQLDKSDVDRFGDTCHDQLILSSKAPGYEGDVQTFTIERPPPSGCEEQEPKLKKLQRVPAKPHKTIITSTGQLIQPGDQKKDEDVFFDINSMPIVLSEEIITPVSVANVPASSAAGAGSATKVIPEPRKDKPKVIIGNITNKSTPIIKKYNADMKPSNIILKPITEKTASPNILSKSPKVKAMKHMLVVDQSTGEQKIVVGKPDDFKDTPVQVFGSASKVVKHSPGILSKPEKFIIVPSSGNASKFTVGKRQQKIIMNPQTGKAQVILRSAEPSEAIAAAGQSKGKGQNRLSLDASTGNTIMILTHGQGRQSKIVLTPEHQRLLFSKGNMQASAISPQSIFTSKGTIITPVGGRGKSAPAGQPSRPASGSQLAGEALITSTGQLIGGQLLGGQLLGGQLVTQRLAKKPGPGPGPGPAKSQLLVPGNGSGRTILTARPNQTILTSKGQLITSQSSSVTSQSKIISNITKTTTVLAQPNQQFRVLKTSQPQKSAEKVKHGVLLQTVSKADKPALIGRKPSVLLKTAAGQNQPTVIQSKGNFLSQKTVVHLTPAQFEHLKKTGDLDQFIQKPLTQMLASPAKPVQGKVHTQKVILQKYSPANRQMNQSAADKKQAEQQQSALKHKLHNTYSSSLPPLSLIQQSEPSAVPVKKTKLRELLTLKSEAGNQKKPAVSTVGMPSKSKVIENRFKAPERSQAVMELENLDELIPATTISTRKQDPPRTDIFQTGEGGHADHSVSSRFDARLPDNIMGPEDAQPPEAQEAQALAGQPAQQGQQGQQGQQAQPASANTLADGQLLAVPGENFGGPPNSFFLCMEENGTLTPIDNQPLVLENNQLVPMVMPSPIAEMPLNDSSVTLEPKAGEVKELSLTSEGQQQILSLPADQGQQNILINAGDQQILLDQQTLLSLLAGDNQQLVTADGQQLILQGNVQQILTALAGNPEIASLLSGGQQILLNAGAAESVEQSASAGAEGFLYPQAAQPSTNANQDILAAALANTDVFQPEPLIPDSLNISTNSHTDGLLMSMESLSPGFQNLNANVSVHSHVSETSSTLNQPIMSPLEVPSKKRKSAEGGRSLLCPAAPNIDSVAHNLEDSLAGIGVTTPNIPTSLDLPITVTNPRIAPKTTNPLSLSCGVVYQSPGLLSTSMMSPGVGISDSETTQARMEMGEYDSSRGSLQASSLLMGSNTRTSSLAGFSGGKLSSHEEESQSNSKPPPPPLAASSMPCLDDSSSESFVGDAPQPTNTVETKIYSPISMPLLTEDVPVETTIKSAVEVAHVEATMEVAPVAVAIDGAPEEAVIDSASVETSTAVEINNATNIEAPILESPQVISMPILIDSDKSVDKKQNPLESLIEHEDCINSEPDLDNVEPKNGEDVKITPSTNIEIPEVISAERVIEDIPEVSEGQISIESEMMEQVVAEEEDSEIHKSINENCEEVDSQTSLLHISKPVENIVGKSAAETSDTLSSELSEVPVSQQKSEEITNSTIVPEQNISEDISVDPATRDPQLHTRYDNEIINDDIELVNNEFGQDIEHLQNERASELAENNIPSIVDTSEINDQCFEATKNTEEDLRDINLIEESALKDNNEINLSDFPESDKNHEETKLPGNSNVDLDIEPSSVPSETCESPCELPEEGLQEVEGNSLGEQQEQEQEQHLDHLEHLEQHSDASSDASAEIPVQPRISVSQQHLLQNLAEQDKRPTDEDLFSSNLKTSPKRFKFDDER